MENDLRATTTAREWWINQLDLPDVRPGAWHLYPVEQVMDDGTPHPNQIHVREVVQPSAGGATPPSKEAIKALQSWRKYGPPWESTCNEILAFLQRTPPSKTDAEEALKFIQRLSGPNRGCHIISSGNLTEFQIAFARAHGLFFIDADGLGYAMLPLPEAMVAPLQQPPQSTSEAAR